MEKGCPIFDEPINLVKIGPQPHHSTKMGNIVNQLLRSEIDRLLVVNADLFA